MKFSFFFIELRKLYRENQKLKHENQQLNRMLDAALGMKGVLNG